VKDTLMRQGPWTEVGAWWDRKGENEIDAIAWDVRSRKVLFAEVKWRDREVGWRTVEGLIEKAELPKVDSRWDRRFLVVSRSGFTERCLERMDSENILHWDLDDIGKIAWTDNR
jgi:hypothetical protein